jgi:hypothetical protein
VVKKGDKGEEHMKLLYIPTILVGLIIAPVRSEEPETELLTRKKNHSLSIVLLGLAQSCNQVSELLTAEDQAAKQQGLLNVIGTVLATAAQLSIPQNKKSNSPTGNQTKQPLHDQTPADLTHLCALLFEEIDQEELAKLAQQSPLLTELMATDTSLNREELTRTFMASPAKANQFIDELFALLTIYLTKKIPLLTERLKQNVINHLAKH